MRILVAISLLCLCLALLAVGPVRARGWRGIVPLHSTRADVERLLGPPTEETSNYSVFYRTPNETVIIQYAQGLPCGIGEKYSQWRVPRNTVASILVTPTQPVSVSDLGLDESKYKKRSGGHRSEDVYYINDQAGESIVVFMNEVRGMSYFPGAVDANLICPGLAGRPTNVKCEGLTPPRFSSFGKVASEREKSLLDNFVITLLEKDRTGYIIAYAGKQARVGEAKARAERAKNYLVKIRSFSPNRLKAIDGGYREQPEVDLYVVPKGVCPPTPDPTVDPRDVRILKDGKTRNSRRSSKLILPQKQIALPRER